MTSEQDFESRLKTLNSTLVSQGRVQDVMEQFCKLVTDAERVQFLQNMPEAHLISQGLTTSESSPVKPATQNGAETSTNSNGFQRPKSAIISEQMRNAGNSHFCRKQYSLAVDMYSEAIESAPVPTPSATSHLGLALANRSAALFQLGDYRRCREDISAALRNNYPPDQHCKLYERLGEASSRLGEGRTAEQAFCKALKAAKLAKMDDKQRVKMLRKLDELMVQSAAERITRILAGASSTGDVELEDSWNQKNGSVTPTQCKPLKRSEATKKTNTGSHSITSKNVSEKPATAGTSVLEAIQEHGKQCNPKLPPLTHGRQKELPAASAAVRLEVSKEQGRMLVADTDLHPGDVVIVEPAFCFCLLPELWKSHCYGCCRQLKKGSSTCSGGCQVRFCSGECQAASAPLHQLECAALPRLLVLDVGPMALLSLRLAAAAGPRQLRHARLAACNNNAVSSPLAAPHALVGHGDRRSAPDLFRRTAMAVCLARLLMDGPLGQMSGGCVNGNETVGMPSDRADFGHRLNGEVTEENVSAMSPAEVHAELACGILHYLQSLPCNAHEISEHGVSASSAELQEIGASVYPTVSLMNHSCDPNIVRVSYGTACVVQVIRPVRKGEEVLDNYGYHYGVQKRQQRQVSLSRQYFFTCRCRACTEEWTTHDLLPPREFFRCEQCDASLTQCYHGRSSTKIREYSKSRGIYLEAMDRLKNRTSVAADPFVKHLEMLDRLVLRPSREYNECQEAVKFHFLSDGNNVTSSATPTAENATESCTDSTGGGNCILRIYGENVALKCQ